jgi:restriction system protein
MRTPATQAAALAMAEPLIRQAAADGAQLVLTPEERAELLPSGKQSRFANRVNWAKAYLAKAGLVENTRRGYFRITPRGQAALADAAATINNAYLDQFKEFQDFKAKENEDEATALEEYSADNDGPRTRLGDLLKEQLDR